MLLSIIAVSESGIRPAVEILSGSEVIPALPLKGIKIGIDPGHQEKANNEQETISPTTRETKAKVASGTRGVATGVYEYMVNLDVSYMLKDFLSDLGADVLMTRYSHDVNISNQERAIMMNEWGADLVLRIHCNGSTNQDVNGMGMYVRKTGAFAKESALLAEWLIDEMVKTSGANSQGVFKRNTYTGLNYSEVPSVLVEMGYMTNPQEDQKLNDPEYQMRLVAGMVNGIIGYVNESQASQ